MEIFSVTFGMPLVYMFVQQKFCLVLVQKVHAGQNYFDQQNNYLRKKTNLRILTKD